MLHADQTIYDMAARCEASRNQKIARISCLSTANWYKAHLTFKTYIIRYNCAYYLTDGQSLLTITDLREVGL